jgi:hypothetical protein
MVLVMDKFCRGAWLTVEPCPPKRVFLFYQARFMMGSTNRTILTAPTI